MVHAHVPPRRLCQSVTAAGSWQLHGRQPTSWQAGSFQDPHLHVRLVGAATPCVVHPGSR